MSRIAAEDFGSPWPQYLTYPVDYFGTLSSIYSSMFNDGSGTGARRVPAPSAPVPGGLESACSPDCPA